MQIRMLGVSSNLLFENRSVLLGFFKRLDNAGDWGMNDLGGLPLFLPLPDIFVANYCADNSWKWRDARNQGRATSGELGTEW